MSKRKVTRVEAQSDKGRAQSDEGKLPDYEIRAHFRRSKHYILTGTSEPATALDMRLRLDFLPPPPNQRRADLTTSARTTYLVRADLTQDHAGGGQLEVILLLSLASRVEESDYYASQSLWSKWLHGFEQFGLHV